MLSVFIFKRFNKSFNQYKNMTLSREMGKKGDFLTSVSISGSLQDVVI